jgi:hypothetical protein
MGSAGSDVAFMLVANNIRRIGNFLTRYVHKECLKILSLLFSAVSDIMGAIFAMVEVLKPAPLKLSGENRLKVNGMKRNKFVNQTPVRCHC